MPTPSQPQGAGWSRRLGASGPPATAIGLGLAALGRPGYLNLGHGDDLGGDRSVEALERHAHEMLDAARASGVRYLDAARSYGLAERFLAAWLERRGVGRDELTVGSKWGYAYTAGWRVDADPPEVKDLGADALRRQLAETRALLGDRLDLYQVHSATLESGVLEDAEVLDTLAELRAGGVAVGLSVTGPGQAETIARALEVGGFDTVQATWNLLEPSAAAALARASEAGLGVIVKEAVANGRLTARGREPALERVERRLEAAPDAVAIAAALARPWVDVVLSGAGTPAQLASNMAGFELTLDAAAERELAALAEPPERYWATRAALGWN